MGKVMEELLIKAQRDKSKLVQVQRSVSRNGKTFMQNFLGSALSGEGFR